SDARRVIPSQGSLSRHQRALMPVMGGRPFGSRARGASAWAAEPVDLQAPAQQRAAAVEAGPEVLGGDPPEVAPRLASLAVPRPQEEGVGQAPGEPGEPPADPLPDLPGLHRPGRVAGPGGRGVPPAPPAVEGWVAPRDLLGPVPGGRTSSRR